MDSFEKISKMNLSELGEKKEEENDRETLPDGGLAEGLDYPVEEVPGELAAAEEPKTQEKPSEIPEPQGRYYYVDANIKEKEMISFLMGHNYRQPMTLIVTAIGIIWSAMMLIQKQGSPLVAAVVFIAFVAIMPISAWTRGKTTVKNSPVYRETFHYMFDEKGIHLKIKNETIDVEWNRVVKTMFLKSALALYTSKINAYLVPVAALGDRKEEIEGFIKEMTRKR